MSDNDAYAKTVHHNPFVRRLIPAAAAASLTLGGAMACSDGYVEGSNEGGSGMANFPPPDVPQDQSDGGGMSSTDFRALCETFSTCLPEDFSDMFSNTEACVEYLQGQLETYIAYYSQYYGQECVDAFEAYYTAYLNAYSCVDGELILDDPQGELEQLQMDFDEVCGFNDDPPVVSNNPNNPVDPPTDPDMSPPSMDMGM